MTQLRCGGIFNNSVTANLPQSMPVKQFLKSVDIWWRYKQKFGGMFFWLTVYIYVRLTDIMHLATPHGDWIITKLYFAIFMSFKESMTLSALDDIRLFILRYTNARIDWLIDWISFKGHSRSYILVTIKSPYTTLYMPLIVTFASFFNLSEILPVVYARANCVSI